MSTIYLKWLMGFASGAIVALGITLGVGLPGWAVFALWFSAPLVGAVALVTFAN